MSDRPLDFRPGHTVHWIQARHAWEDLEDWRRGRLTSVEGRKLEVELADKVRRMYWSDSAPRFAGVLPARVYVNERYSVLAMESGQGNVIVNDEIAPPPGSIFDLSRGNLLFISIAKVDDSET
jgi:hypothetical protein